MLATRTDILNATRPALSKQLSTMFAHVRNGRLVIMFSLAVCPSYRDHMVSCGRMIRWRFCAAPDWAQSCSIRRTLLVPDHLAWVVDWTAHQGSREVRVTIAQPSEVSQAKVRRSVRHGRHEESKAIGLGHLLPNGLGCNRAVIFNAAMLIGMASDSWTLLTQTLNTEDDNKLPKRLNMSSRMWHAVEGAIRVILEDENAVSTDYHSDNNNPRLTWLREWTRRSDVRTTGYLALHPAQQTNPFLLEMSPVQARGRKPGTSCIGVPLPFKWCNFTWTRSLRLSWSWMWITEWWGIVTSARSSTYSITNCFSCS